MPRSFVTLHPSGSGAVSRPRGSGRAGRPPPEYLERGGPASAVHRSGPGSPRPGWMRSGRCLAETAPPEACRGHYQRQPINRSMFNSSGMKSKVSHWFRGCAFSGSQSSLPRNRNPTRSRNRLRLRRRLRLGLRSRRPAVVTMFPKGSGPCVVHGEAAGPAALHPYTWSAAGLRRIFATLLPKESWAYAALDVDPCAA